MIELSREIEIAVEGKAKYSDFSARYVSHESTIAFAGEQLSGISETIIPDRYRY